MADVIQAVKWMKRGKHVRRESWKNRGYFIYLDPMREFYWGSNEPGGEISGQPFSDWEPRDFLGNDWCVAEDQSHGEAN